MRSERARPWSLLLWTLVFLGAFDALAGLEEALTRFPGYAVWPPHHRAGFTPDPRFLPGISGASRFSVNGQGFRGDPVREDHALYAVALGGSTTESLYLDDREAWPRLVQDRLDVARAPEHTWVGNAGRSSVSSRGHVLQARHLLPQFPRIDLLILMVGMNDLHHRLASDTAFRTIRDEPKAVRELVARVAFAHRPAQPVEVLLHRWRPQGLLERFGSLLPWAAARGSDAFELDASGEAYERWRSYRRQARAFRTRLPNLDAALDEYRSNLHIVLTQAARHGVAVLLVTQPVLWREGLAPEQERLLWQGGIGEYQSGPGHEYYATAALARAMARYNAATLAVCAERGAARLDLAPRLSGDPALFYDDCHFNEEGARRVADAIAEALGNGPLPDPPQARAARRDG